MLAFSEGSKSNFEVPQNLKSGHGLAIVWIALLLRHSGTPTQELDELELYEALYSRMDTSWNFQPVVMPWA